MRSVHDSSARVVTAPDPLQSSENERQVNFQRSGFVFFDINGVARQRFAV
jgi:hypothetical protein